MAKTTIIAGCTVRVIKGCHSHRLVKGVTLKVLEVTPMGSEYSHQVRVRFQALQGVRMGEQFALYARHINRLSDPFTRLHNGDPTLNVEIKFQAAPAAYQDLGLKDKVEPGDVQVHKLGVRLGRGT